MSGCYLSRALSSIHVPKLRFSSKYSDVLALPIANTAFGLRWGPPMERRVRETTQTKSPGIEMMKGSESGGYHKEFYVCSAVRAEQTRAAHLLLRMSPGHSRCALIASPAQRVQTCTASWKSKGDDTRKEPQADAWSSESGGYLLSHDATQYHRRC